MKVERKRSMKFSERLCLVDFLDPMACWLPCFWIRNILISKAMH